MSPVNLVLRRVWCECYLKYVPLKCFKHWNVKSHSFCKNLSYLQRKCASNVAILYDADGISI